MFQSPNKDQPIYQKMTNTHMHTHETYHPIRLGPPFDPNRPEWVSFATVGPLLPLEVAMMMMVAASWVVVAAAAAAATSWWMVVVGTFGD